MVLATFIKKYIKHTNKKKKKTALLHDNSLCKFQISDNLKYHLKTKPIIKISKYIYVTQRET